MSDDESSTNPKTTPTDTGNGVNTVISKVDNDGAEIQGEEEEEESDSSFTGFESHTGANIAADDGGDEDVVETDANLPQDEKGVVNTDTILPEDTTSEHSKDDGNFAAFETYTETNDNDNENDDESESMVNLPRDVSRSESSADEADASVETKDNTDSNDNNDNEVASDTNIPQVESLEKTAVDDNEETEGVGDDNEPPEVTESEIDDPNLVPTCRFLKTKLPTSSSGVGDGFDSDEDGETSEDENEGVTDANPGTADHKTEEVDPTQALFISKSPPRQSPTNGKGNEIAASAPPTSQMKNRSFQNLRSYEAKRRQIYIAKLQSSSYYWRAFRELLSNALQETERVENVVRAGLLSAKYQYEALRAASEDRLDWNGMAVTDPSKLKKLKEEKRRKYSRLGGGGKSAFAMLQDKLGREKDGKSLSLSDSMEEDAKEKSTAEGNLDESGLLNRKQESLFDSNSLVHAFLESQNAMADRFQENISFVTDVSLKKIMQLKQELEGEVYIITMLGDAIVEELERAEQDVQDAWFAYYDMSRGNFDTSTNSSPDANQQFPGNFTPDDIHDVWVVEMHYRMSVAYLTTTWEHSSSELSKLFQSMKEVECNRRYRLRELLLLHMQRQERLWLSIPGLVSPVVKDLMDRPTDLPTVEKAVQTQLRGRATDIRREKEIIEAKKKAAVKQTSSVKSPRSAGSGLSSAEALSPDYELVSPLMSELMLKADVVEKKSDSGIIGKWKTTLVIATSDSFLHFFDIPPGSGVRPGGAAEVAFQALVPPIAVPNEDMIKNGKIVFGKSWYEYLIPADSINLKRSTISLNQSKGDCIFEVTENVEATGAAKIFNLKTQRKFSIRLFSNHEMVNWLLALGMAA